MASLFQDSNSNIYATEYPLFNDADAIPAEELPDYSSLLQDFFYETGWCLGDFWYLCRSVVGVDLTNHLFSVNHSDCFVSYEDTVESLKQKDLQRIQSLKTFKG